LIKNYLHKLSQHLWYGNTKLSKLLLPFSYVYKLIFKLRTFIIKRFFCWQAKVPIIVVGNLTVGGVGKTPLVIAIANYYTQQGLKVGIVSRGYGARGCKFPHLVTKEDSAKLVGDEPLLIARSTNCKVMIAPLRVLAVKELLKRFSIDLIISDDGLQHAFLARKIEIVVIDSERLFGNGYLLPAGPLREPITRLKTVDFIVFNGNTTLTRELHFPSYLMQIKPCSLKSIKTGQEVMLASLKDNLFTAIAGIGHPQRFFASLKLLGLQNFTATIFPDHYAYKEAQLAKIEGPLVMTEKDAIKCMSFAKDDWYSLGIELTISDEFWAHLTQQIYL